MENFTLAQLLPIDSAFAVDVNNLSSNVDVNNLPTSHLHNHHKDHMLAAGATPNLIYECISHKCDPIITTSTAATTTATATTTTTCADTTSSGKTLISMKSDYTAFTNCIQQSALLDQRSGTVDISIEGVSLSSFCDLKFASPSMINGSVTPASDNAVITSVRDLTPHNFKGIQLIEPKSTITNNSSDLNDDLPNTFSGNALFFSNNLTHHIQAVAPKSVFETNLPQYYNLTKLTSNSSMNSNIYQELPNATTKTNNQQFDISLNNSESSHVDSHNTSQLVNNNKSNNHNINNMDTQNLDRSSNNNNNNNNNSLPIYLIANDDGSTTNTANMVQNAYTNTHQQQHQQQQQQQHQYKNQNQLKRTKKKLSATTTANSTALINTTIITATTTTTTTAAAAANTTITTPIENCQSNNNNNHQHQTQQQQQEQHCPIVTNIELISRITTTAITTTTSTATTITVSALPINSNNNNNNNTSTTTTTNTLNNAAILSDCNSSNIDISSNDNQMQQKKNQNKCKSNNLHLQNNCNKQDDSSDCDDTDSMSCSDDYIDIEMNGCFGK